MQTCLKIGCLFHSPSLRPLLQSLADLLEATHRGYFIFPRPDKNRIDRQLSNEELTRSRVGELERYLRYLADHPTVGASEELATFLTAEGALQAAYDWQRLQPVRGSVLEGVSRLPRQLLGVDVAVPSAAEASQNARNTSDLLRRLRELNERMRQDYGASQAPLEGDEVALRVGRAGLRKRRGGSGDRASRRTFSFFLSFFRIFPGAQGQRGELPVQAGQRHAQGGEAGAGDGGPQHR